MKLKYESLGGTILEDTSLSRVDVYSDVAHLKLSSKVRICSAMCHLTELMWYDPGMVIYL